MILGHNIQRSSFFNTFGEVLVSDPKHSKLNSVNVSFLNQSSSLLRSESTVGNAPGRCCDQVVVRRQDIVLCSSPGGVHGRGKADESDVGQIALIDLLDQVRESLQSFFKGHSEEICEPRYYTAHEKYEPHVVVASTR